MGMLTVEGARALLMEEDIAPMSALADEQVGAEPGSEVVPDKGRDVETGTVTDAKPDGGAPSGELSDGESAARSFAEGVVGLGVDIVEIERMKSILTRQPNFATRVFSLAERSYCDKKASPATHYALRFAAKEAVVKALGTGFSDGIWVRDIEVERAKGGKPSVKLSGHALKVAEEIGVRDLSLSMSYTHTDAVACAMAVTDGALLASEKRKDPMEELARQFKETRKMLDDL